MKISKYLNLILSITYSSCIIAMEQPNISSQDIKTIPNIPIGAFQELAKAGIKLNAGTEKEMFAVPDKFMKAGGGSAKAIMNLVKETGLKKGIKNYTYGDFKNDIIDDVIDFRARKEAALELEKKHPFLSAPGTKKFYAENPEKKLNILKKYGYPKNKIEIAAKMQAYNWVKHQLKYDKFFQEELNKTLIKIYNQKNIDLKQFESLLQFGANPNSDGGDGDLITSWRILLSGYPDSLKILELLLKYKANPNIQAKDSIVLDTGSQQIRSGQNNNRPLQRAIILGLSRDSALFNDKVNPKNVLEMIKLLLKYGANASLKDDRGYTALDDAKVALKEYVGSAAYYSGYGKETEITKVLKEIISLLEQEMKKKYEEKIIKKEERPFIGIM